MTTPPERAHIQKVHYDKYLHAAILLQTVGVADPLKNAGDNSTEVIAGTAFTNGVKQQAARGSLLSITIDNISFRSVHRMV
jgi:hypothetical protein